MNGRPDRLDQLFYRKNKYVIPPYQRTYEWKYENWHRILKDVMDQATLSDDTHRPIHWMGILLLSSRSKSPGEHITEYTVVDGQQRLVTLRLLLAAIEHYEYELNKKKLDLEYPIFSVQHSDQNSFQAAINNEWRSRKKSFYKKPSGPIGAYAYFRWILWLGEDALCSDTKIPMPVISENESSASIEEEWDIFLNSKKNKKPIVKGITPCLDRIATAALNRLIFYSLIHDTEDEAPEIIFDTLNSTQMTLTPYEHLRNSLFVRISDAKMSKETHEVYWSPFDPELKKVKTRGEDPQSQFIYDYLISQGASSSQGTISVPKGASHFRDMTSNLQDVELIDFIIENISYNMWCWPTIFLYRNNARHNGKELFIAESIKQLLQSINELSEGPPAPAVLLYLSAYARGDISEKELKIRLHLIEGYVARWILSGERAQNLRANIMGIMGKISQKTDHETLREGLSKNWKSDKEICSMAIQNNHPYYEKIGKPRTISAILRCIERQISGEASHWFEFGKTDKGYTVEHIFPQNCEKWESDFDFWKVKLFKMRPLLHTLGNLTVVAGPNNPALSNKRFEEKKKFMEDNKAAPFRINKKWLGEKKWTPDLIKQRTEYLIEQALKYFKFD